MALLLKKSWENVFGEFRGSIRYSRFYRSKVDLKELRPMILKRIKERKKHYPINYMTPVAQQVLKDRAKVIQGVSTLLKAFPIVTCKFCPEVYIGEKGHLIRTCSGPRRKGKKTVHMWVSGGLNDILVPVEAFHLKEMFQDVIQHHQRFDFDRIPAVVELCWQAGVVPSYKTLRTRSWDSGIISSDVEKAESLSPDDLKLIAIKTYKAWKLLRTGVQKLMLVYPTKVCKHCSEVHVGPSGHMAKLCGVFKYESWRGTHFWRNADLDDIVPSKLVWRRRPHDPPVLLHEGLNFYGHLPAVVELCTQAGFVPPPKYDCLMKKLGSSGEMGRVVVR